MFKKRYNQFIKTMVVPIYNNCTSFYYYDVLEALSRHLFQCIINEKRDKMLEKNQEKKPIDEGRVGTFASEQQDINSQSTQRDKANEKKHTEGSDQKEEYVLSKKEQEDLDDILEGDLEIILEKLEEIGNEIKDIEKYKEMSGWRKNREKTVRAELNHLTDGDKTIIDSSMLIGAMVIQRYFKEKKERRALRQNTDGNESMTFAE